MCYGFCAAIQYFKCEPGYGVFTTIERVIPMSYSSICNGSIPKSQPSDLDTYSEKNIQSMMNNMNEEKPKYEEIVTKYGEYPTKKFSTNKSTGNTYLRNSLSLQNMLDLNNATINTNNDFDQNSVIQPEKTILMKKPKSNVESDLIDVIGGKWSGSTDRKQLEDFSKSMKRLDKNDNIKEKHTVIENNTLSRRNKSVNLLHHIIDGSGTLKKNSKFYTNNVLDDKEEHKTTTLKIKSKCNLLYNKTSDKYK